MGPAKNIAVKQVNRPTDTTAIWLSLPFSHTTWAFLETRAGSSSHRSWNAGSAWVPWSLGLESLAGLLGMTPPPLVCWPPCEFNLSGNLQKVAAIMNKQIRRVRILNKMTPTGEATKLVLCGREREHSFNTNPCIFTICGKQWGVVWRQVNQNVQPGVQPTFKKALSDSRLRRSWWFKSTVRSCRFWYLM